MKGSKHFFAIWFLILFSSVAVSGCLRGTDESSGSGVTVGPPIGQVDDSSFYVRICKGDPDTGGFPESFGGECQATSYFLHQAGDRTAECKVASISSDSSWSTRNIECYLEAYELDLWKDGLQINLNVPRSVCEYVKFRPYWYWNFQPGPAPATATITRDSDGNCLSGTVASGGFFNPETCQVVCNYDYKAWLSENAPNCCEGTTEVTVSTPGEPDVTTKLRFDGKTADCAAGPGKDGGTLDANDMPVPTIFSVGSAGLNTAFNVRPPAKANGGLPLNVHVSNYFNSSDHANGLPIVFNGHMGYRPEQYYAVECLNEAAEVKARIKLQVRDWDRKSEFDAYKAGSSADVDSDSNSNLGGGAGVYFGPANVFPMSDTIQLSGRLWLPTTSVGTPTPVTLVLLNPGSGHSLPGGLSEGVQYYLKVVSTAGSGDLGQDTIQLSTDAAGSSVVDISSQGGSGSVVYIFANDIPDLESPRNDFRDWRDYGQSYPALVKK